jgi:hypothetical protein
MIEIRKELLDWLESASFVQHAGKPNLYMRVLDDSKIAYIDFRKVNKGRRYYTEGNDIKDDADSIEVLVAFKKARDALFENKLVEVPKKQEMNGEKMDTNEKINKMHMLLFVNFLLLLYIAVKVS